ncbi:putative holin-like toxin [Leuconostoc citreum]
MMIGLGMFILTLLTFVVLLIKNSTKITY